MKSPIIKENVAKKILWHLDSHLDLHHMSLHIMLCGLLNQEQTWFTSLFSLCF